MGTLLFLMEATSEVGGGFGFHLDVLESNIINLAILLVILIYYGSKVVGNILSERRAKIAENIEAVETKQKQAAATLAQEQEKLAQAKATAAKIRSDASENAQKASEAILAQGEKEVERIKATAQADLNSEQERAIAELKRMVAKLALERVESQLGEILNDEAQQKLIDLSIAQLGGN